MEHQKKQWEIWQPLLLAVIMAVGMWVGTRIDDELPATGLLKKHQAQDDQWDALLNAIGYVKSQYGEDLDVDSISSEMIDKLVSYLDPHSYYLDGRDYTYFQERMAGQYTGIGIEYDLLRDTCRLLRVFEDGPADRLGLKLGDMILRIGDKDISGQSLHAPEVYAAWRETGESFDIRYIPYGEHEPIDTSIEKGPIVLQSVPVSFALNEQTGYIKITRFSTDTYRDFMEAFEPLVEGGIKHLILDVRNNPGGSLQEVVKILDQLIYEPDQLMLYMDGKHVKKTEYKSTGKVFFRIENVAVLINERSVSASEVLAGVLQDLGRATVVGRRSFGKALVQEMFELDDDAALNLSIGKYFLASGRYIQKDYADKEAYEKELKRRIQTRELYYEDSIKIPDQHLAEATDGALRPVGEGVLPDIFVPAEPLFTGEKWQGTQERIYKEAFSFYLHNAEDVAEAQSYEDFEQFQMSPALIQSLHPLRLALPLEMDVPFFEEELQRAFVHTLIWLTRGEPALHEMAWQQDPVVLAALRAIDQKPTL